MKTSKKTIIFCRPMLIGLKNESNQFWLDITIDYFLYAFSFHYLKKIGLLSEQILRKNMNCLETLFDKIKPRAFNDDYGVKSIPNMSKENYLREFISPLARKKAKIIFRDFLKPRIDKQKKVCESCNKPYLSKKSNSKYCDKCRRKAPVYAFRKKHQKTIEQRECQYCEIKFTPKRITKIYCSDKCRFAAHLKKKKLNLLLF